MSGTRAVLRLKTRALTRWELEIYVQNPDSSQSADIADIEVDS